MSYQYITSNEQDLSKGIDKHNAPSNIQQGFCEDIVNADLTGSGIEKRNGSISRTGEIPIRVQSVKYDDTEGTIRLTLPEDVDLSEAGAGPLLLEGKTSVSEITSPINSTTYEYVYITSYAILSEITLPAAQNSVVFDASGFTDSVGVFGLLSTENEIIYPDSYEWDQDDGNITINYTVIQDTIVFPYFIDLSDADNTVNYYYVNGVTAASSVTILGTTHNLPTTNIIPVVRYVTDGVNNIVEDLSLINKVTINASDDVTIDFDEVPTGDLEIILMAGRLVNTETGTVGAETSLTVTLPTSDKYLFPAIYLEDGTSKEQIYADTVLTNQSGVAEVSFTNESADDVSFQIYWVSGDAPNNSLVIDGTGTADVTDDSASLTIHGLINADVRTEEPKYLDRYIQGVDNKYLLASDGEILYREDDPVIGAYTYWGNRTLSATVTGPLFQGDTYPRTSGYLKSADVLEGLLEVTSVAYNESTGATDYTIKATGYESLDSSGVPTALANLLKTGYTATFTNMGWSETDGTYVITALTAIDVDSFMLSVTNSNVGDSDYDETDVGGIVGVFCDILELQNTSELHLDDVLILGDLFDSRFTLSVIDNDATVVGFCGVTSNFIIPSTLRVGSSRISACLPMTNAAGTKSVANLVKGYTVDRGDNPTSMVTFVYPYADTAATIADSIVTVADTSLFQVGAQLPVVGVYNGVMTILSLISTTELEVDITASGSLTITGFFINVDAEWAFSSSLSTELSVDRRWTPVERPAGITPSYLGNTLIRSSQANNSMYLAEEDRSVWKYDGVNAYRAGLPRYPSHTFATIDSASAGKVIIDYVSGDVALFAAGDNFFDMTAIEDVDGFTIGRRISLLADDVETDSFTVIKIDVTNKKVYVNKPITTVYSGPVTYTLNTIATYKYYMRLNAIDRFGNITAGAALGSTDLTIELVEDAAVHLAGTNLPASLDVFDYDRLEVQIFRTLQDQVAPFYNLVTISLDSTTEGFTFTDTLSDLDIGLASNLDTVNSVLLGNEIGTTWSGPLLAKSVASIGNTLICGNLTSYPQLSVNVENVDDTADYDGQKWVILRNTLDTQTDVLDLDNELVLSCTSSSDAATLAHAAGVITATFAAPPSVVEGDYIYVFYSGDLDRSNRDVSIIGWKEVLSVAGNDLTYAGTMTGTPTVEIAAVTTAFPVYVGDDDINLQSRAGLSGSPKGFWNLRMATAINATQTFATEAWIVVVGGGDVEPGQLLLEKATSKDGLANFGLVTPLTSPFPIFVNRFSSSLDTKYSSVITEYPARVIKSYANFPEIFDNVTAAAEVNSDSVFDINADDGQAIVSVVPFLTESAFGAAQTSGVAVILKTNSIYLMDLDGKSTGKTIQKVESGNLGCEFPLTVCNTRRGVMFANRSGVYLLNKNLQVEYVGRMLEDFWKSVDIEAAVTSAVATNYSTERRYKLQVPLLDGSSTTLVWHDNETTMGWSRYINQDPLMYTNLESDSFYLSARGRVLAIATDQYSFPFRDENALIDMLIKFRPNDFGDRSVRKVVRGISVYYQSEMNLDNCTLSIAGDFNQTATPTNEFKVTGSEDGPSLDVIQHSSPIRRFLWLQVWFQNDGLDESPNIVDIGYRVGGLSGRGVQQAQETN